MELKVEALVSELREMSSSPLNNPAASRRNFAENFFHEGEIFARPPLACHENPPRIDSHLPLDDEILEISGFISNLRETVKSSH